MGKLKLSRWIKYLSLDNDGKYIRASLNFDKFSYPPKKYNIKSKIIKISDDRWSYQIKDNAVNSNLWYSGSASSLEEAVFFADLMASENGYDLIKPFFL